MPPRWLGGWGRSVEYFQASNRRTELLNTFACAAVEWFNQAASKESTGAFVVIAVRAVEETSRLVMSAFSQNLQLCGGNGICHLSLSYSSVVRRLGKRKG